MTDNSTSPRHHALAVFCGASTGRDPVYAAAAAATGRLLAEHRIRVVTGGGQVGLMGVVADAVLAAGGEVIGVIPHALDHREVGHQGLTHLHVVDTMHERKTLISGMVDGFIALPGGYGTFEELFEMVTWTQLGIHAKPVGLLNVKGFYDPLLALLDGATDEGFINEINRSLILCDSTPEALLAQIQRFTSPVTAKWLRLGES